MLRLYWAWRNARNRCRLKSHPKFYRYGGRGIRFCKRWDDFKTFAADVLSEIGPPRAGRSLDRRRNNDHYRRGNIRWATPKMQAANRENSR